MRYAAKMVASTMGVVAFGLLGFIAMTLLAVAPIVLLGLFAQAVI